jgi:hypothetical protein
MITAKVAMGHRPENAASKQAGRFQPGGSANPAGKNCTRNRATMLDEKLMTNTSD